METPRILLVYYSRTGTTRALAKALSARLKCDIEEIAETKSRAGIIGYMRSAIEAQRQRPSAYLAPTKKDPSRYELVIIGTPVWAWSVSSPVRAYMAANRSRLPDVAFFCTMGGAGSARGLAQMRDLAGKAPRACLGVSTADVALKRYSPRLEEFVEAVTEPMRVALMPA